MAKRLIGGGIALAIIVVLLVLHGWYTAIGFTLVALFVEFEILSTVKASGIKPVSIVLYIFTASLAPVYYFFDLSGVFVVEMLCLVVIFAAGIIFKQFDFESIFSSLFCMQYPQLFFVFIYMIVFVKNPVTGQFDTELSRLMLIIAFGTANMADLFAYFIGRFLGKTPLCPSISPKKTVEGAIGGIVGGICGALLFAVLFDNGRVHLIEYVILALVLSIFSQIGDLASSVVKRRFGVKDFGKILPGHGGFLDRMDSTLFILPIVFLFYKFYLHL